MCLLFLNENLGPSVTPSETRRARSLAGEHRHAPLHRDRERYAAGQNLRSGRDLRTDSSTVYLAAALERARAHTEHVERSPARK